MLGIRMLRGYGAHYRHVGFEALAGVAFLGVPNVALLGVPGGALLGVPTIARLGVPGVTFLGVRLVLSEALRGVTGALDGSRRCPRGLLFAGEASTVLKSSCAKSLLQHFDVSTPWPIPIGTGAHFMPARMTASGSRDGSRIYETSASSFAVASRGSPSAVLRHAPMLSGFGMCSRKRFSAIVRSPPSRAKRILRGERLQIGRRDGVEGKDVAAVEPLDHQEERTDISGEAEVECGER